MSNLNNCIVTQYGPVLESSGDSIPSTNTDPSLPDQLELQTQGELESMFGTGFIYQLTSFMTPAPYDLAFGLESEHRMHGHYFLKISAEPGYHITSDQITISGVPSTSSVGVGWDWNDVDENGVNILPNEVYSVSLYDSYVDENGVFITGYPYVNTEESWRCSNFITAVVTLKNEFVMPDNSVVIKIDFDGDAVICNEINPNEEEVAQEDKTLTWEMTTGIIITNEYDNSYTQKKTFCARYYEDEYLYNPFNAHFIKEGDWGDGGPIAPEYLSNSGVDGPSIFADNPEMECLGQSQPSCFRKLGSNASQIYAFTIDVPPDAVHNISTDGGKILIPYHFNYGEVFNDWHPNYFGSSGSPSNVLGFNIGGTNEALKRTYKVYQNIEPTSNSPYPDFIDTPNLSLEDYPVIYPGGGQVPSAETWDIEISGSNGSGWGGDNWQLIAEPEFIDIWGAITIITVQNGEDIGPTTFSINTMGGTQTGDTVLTPTNTNLDVNSITYAKYTAANNECDMDLSNITLTQITPKKVRITVPYRSDLGWVRGSNEAPDGQSDRRFNKIFMNIYPTEI